MIPDDELQAATKAATVFVAGRLLVNKVEEQADEITRLKAENEKLAAELAAKEIRWTDAKPTTPGWWCYRNGEDGWCIVFCSDEIDGSIIAHYLATLHYVDDMRGQWSDKPIPQPEERT